MHYDLEERQLRQCGGVYCEEGGKEEQRQVIHETVTWL